MTPPSQTEARFQIQNRTNSLTRGIGPIIWDGEFVCIVPWRVNEKLWSIKTYSSIVASGKPSQNRFQMQNRSNSLSREPVDTTRTSIWKQCKSIVEIATPSVRKEPNWIFSSKYQFVSLLRDGATVAGSRIPYHSIRDGGLVRIGPWGANKLLWPITTCASFVANCNTFSKPFSDSNLVQY
jgi:hypothetical protein